MKRRIKRVKDLLAKRPNKILKTKRKVELFHSFNAALRQIQKEAEINKKESKRIVKRKRITKKNKYN